MSKLKSKFIELFGIDLRSLALFRMGLALVLIGDLLVRLQDLKAHYSDDGVLPRSALIESFLDPGALSIHLMSGLWQVQLLLFIIQIAFALALLVGYYTRIVTFVSWFLLLSLQLRNEMILQGGDIVLKMLLFWSLFLPLGAYWSLDQKLNKQNPSTFQIFSTGTLALLLQICFIYWFSALLKNDPTWREEGTAIWYALSIEQYATPLGHELLLYPQLLKFLTFTTFYLESYGPFFAFSPIWSGPIRMATVIVFILFHLLGLNLTMELALFPYICAVAWLAFVPGWFWDYVLKKRSQLTQIPPWRAGWLSNLLASFFLLYVFLWNVSTLGIVWPPFSPPSPQIINSMLDIDQKWDMFAPSPLRVDGWYVIPGRLKDGTQIDVMTGKALNWEKPPLLSAIYPNDRWRSYLMNFYITEEGYLYIPYYAHYLCQNWNENHSSDQQLLAFDIYYVVKENSLENPSDPYKKIPLWHQTCSHESSE
jgi:hypothetical protein